MIWSWISNIAGWARIRDCWKSSPLKSIKARRILPSCTSAWTGLKSRQVQQSARQSERNCRTDLTFAKPIWKMLKMPGRPWWTLGYGSCICFRQRSLVILQILIQEKLLLQTPKNLFQEQFNGHSLFARAIFWLFQAQNKSQLLHSAYRLIPTQRSETCINEMQDLRKGCSWCVHF